MLQTALNSTANYSLYPVQYNLKVEFKFAKLYLQRLNVSNTIQQDFMSLTNLTTKTVELISWTPFLASKL